METKSRQNFNEFKENLKMNFTAISQYLNLRMKRDEKGVTTVEYAIMVIVIGVAVLLSATSIPTAIVALFNAVAAKLVLPA
jgi:Flp pilus assembly pilin Flp